MLEQREAMIYRKKENVVSRRIAGEILLVPIRGNLANMERLYVLDEVGEQIWADLDGKKNLEDIRDRICGKFEVDQERAKSDIEEYISKLHTADLIEEVN